MLLSISFVKIEEDDYGGAINIDNLVSIVEDLPCPSESMVVDEPTELAVIEKLLIFQQLVVAMKEVLTIFKMIAPESPWKVWLRGLPYQIGFASQFLVKLNLHMLYALLILT